MTKQQKHFRIGRLIQALCLCCFVFISPPASATYYGGKHYKHHYGHYSYPYYRPYYYNNYRHYRYPYRHSYYNRHHSHYGVSTHISGDVAYVVLGILGAAILAHVFTNNKPTYRNTYPKTYSTTPRVKTVKTAPVKYRTPVKKTIYHYNENEGWERLANGNADYALDIFAVQSQQNLNSGTPKVGFAIAAATMGEKERAIRIMRKAVRIDANALNRIDINTIEPTIKQLTENYQSNKNNINDTDASFMIAALSYLNQDYATANTLIAKNDQSESAKNLRELLKSKL